MKKNLKAFTLAETLIVILVIGVIAAITIPTVGMKTDRNKGIFKKTYSVIERNVAELVNDENLYMNDPDNFGFNEVTDVKMIGADCYTSTTNYSSRVTTKNINFKNRLVKFCNLFSNTINLNGNPTFNSGISATSSANTSDKCNFTSNDGVEWEITDVTTPVNGFMIKIDTNGDKAPNKPSDVSKVAPTNEGKIGNRDRFYIYIRYDGKMELPNSDTVAKDYLKSANLNREEDE